MNTIHCKGCKDNFYNGNNDLGVKECWDLESAKIVFRIPIGLWEKPPYLNKKQVRVPDCWHGKGSNRILYINPEAINAKGYWK